jgi:dihydrofolate reductase
MSSNRIIGINGKLPWRLPKDRKAFKSLTNNKILIIGRRTFEENSLRRHINHAASSVVLSRTLDKELEDSTLRIARSFAEALHIARSLTEELDINEIDNSISCWVAGGERVYLEALVHPNAAELHLTIVESEIRVLADQQSAQFPANYRWDNKFKQVVKHEDVDGGLKITQCVFHRKAGRR